MGERYTPNRYCGPYAVSHLLGCCTGEAAAKLREVSGRRAITGIGARYVLAAVRREGLHPMDVWNFRHLSTRRRPTLAQFLKGKRGGTYLINVTGHYIVADGWKIYDNTHPDGVKRREWHGRRKRIAGAWRFR